MADIEVPDLLPARMLNEYTYCPRLFHLEWVGQQWADSIDTEEGRYHHRRVDRPGGSGEPNEDRPWKARSLQLSSPELGLLARLDVVEADGRMVIPVDVKRGHPPSIPEGAWEPERVQLCAQGLLLREEGHVVPYGELYFAGARRRVRIDFTEELITRTKELIGQARTAAAQPVAPPPLVDSPKCPRCSLVGICLPGEVNTLNERQIRPRTLLPSDPDAEPLYLSDQGGTVRVEKGRLTLWAEGEVKRDVRLIDVLQVNLFGNVNISTAAIRRLLVRDVPVCFFSFGGRFEGMAHGLPGKNVELRRRQVTVTSARGFPIAQRMIAAKILNARTMLRRNASATGKEVLESMGRLANQAMEVESAASLLGVEGTAARQYFSRFTSLLKVEEALPGEPFDFNGRNRRPPKDPVNCLLSFVYALLVKDLTVAAFTVGLDPYMGVYHRPRFGRPALALDLAEEFRPLVGDSVVVGLVNNGEIRPSDFVVRSGGVALTAAGRRRVLRAYERRLRVTLTHPRFGYPVSYRRLFELQARLLGAHLLGEIEDYTPVVTR